MSDFKKVIIIDILIFGSLWIFLNEKTLLILICLSVSFEVKNIEVL